ncbi:hypothetical protein [Micromonospora endolithica]|uniref:Uncharacterized protein n=1 Tax=Micromonospora endolithica TaxID=230091 RepID=A0A3A9ZT41_9ACTN|nr:hypothetical protein [Micromonospora endolithica]RKN50776.1 hypothetical protein D7223_03210 [Micromonospora endolithica]TWJ20468.1 hypothetical protein JD76_00566 [Micromonospora endolithica]
MIAASLLLILLAVVLLVVGLASGSSLLLIVSIAASLLAAVALVVGARQAAVDRATAGRPTRPAAPTSPPYAPRPPAEAYSPVEESFRPAAGPYSPVGEPYSPVAASGVPVQHVPPTVDTGGTGWRQPPGSPVDPGPRDVGAAHDDEPAAQDVGTAEVARLAGLTAEVRVVDGRPRYHLADCPHLVGREHEPLPVAEAVDLGFTSCAHCTPATTLLARRIPSGGAGA